MTKRHRIECQMFQKAKIPGEPLKIQMNRNESNWMDQMGLIDSEQSSNQSFSPLGKRFLVPTIWDGTFNWW